MSGNQGSTIIEVLVVTTMITVVMTAIVAGLSFSVKNTAEARYREYAATEAQKAMEVFRRERVALGWERFTAAMSQVSGENCFNTLPESLTNLTTSGLCGDWYTPISVGSPFKREAFITASGTEVMVTVTVTWQSADDERQIEVFQEFKNTD